MGKLEELSVEFAALTGAAPGPLMVGLRSDDPELGELVLGIMVESARLGWARGARVTGVYVGADGPVPRCEARKGRARCTLGVGHAGRDGELDRHVFVDERADTSPYGVPAGGRK